MRGTTCTDPGRASLPPVTRHGANAGNNKVKDRGELEAECGGDDAEAAPPQGAQPDRGERSCRVDEVWYVDAHTDLVANAASSRAHGGRHALPSQCCGTVLEARPSPRITSSRRLSEDVRAGPSSQICQI